MTFGVDTLLVFITFAVLVAVFVVFLVWALCRVAATPTPRPPRREDEEE